MKTALQLLRPMIAVGIFAAIAIGCAPATQAGGDAAQGISAAPALSR